MSPARSWSRGWVISMVTLETSGHFSVQADSKFLSYRSQLSGNPEISMSKVITMLMLWKSHFSFSVAK